MGGNVLKISCRDIRITASALQYTCYSAPYQAMSGFVQEILNRYKNWQICRPCHDYIFRQSRIMSNLYHAYNTLLLKFTVLLKNGIFPDTTIMNVDMGRNTKMFIPQVIRSFREHLKSERFVHGLTARQLEPESRDISKSVVVQRNTSSSVSQNITYAIHHKVFRAVEQPVPRLLRRSVPVLTSETRKGRQVYEPDRKEIPSGHPMLKQPSFTNRQQADSAPAIDMKRLTDQVIRTIDQRIIAHRERFGKI